jgi:hypothetical protein
MRFPLALQSTELPDLQSSVWIGAVSFEERCVGSCLQLARHRVNVAGAIVIDYPTRAGKASEDLAKRNVHRATIMDRLSTLRAEIVPQVISPYRMSDMRRVLDEASSSTEHGPYSGVILDITCLTKVHTLAAASWVVARPTRRPPVWFAYTLPEQYGSPSRHNRSLGQWLDVAVAPCEFEPMEYSDSVAGIVLLGHEGSRIRLAISQCEPSEALVVVPQTPGRPSLGVVAQTANAVIVRDVRAHRRPGWELVELAASDISGLTRAVTRFCHRAVQNGRRIVLYPFGPKPMILAAAMSAIGAAGARVWYSYPIPRRYDLDYTAGVGPTRWFVAK